MRAGGAEIRSVQATGARIDKVGAASYLNGERLSSRGGWVVGRQVSRVFADRASFGLSKVRALAGA